jgi:hypothetical protein
MQHQGVRARAKQGRAHLQRQGIGLGEGSEAHESLRDGDAGALHELAQLRGRIQAAAADVQHRPLRAVDGVHNRLDVLSNSARMTFSCRVGQLLKADNAAPMPTAMAAGSQVDGIHDARDVQRRPAKDR